MANPKQTKPQKDSGKTQDAEDINHPKVSEGPEQIDPADRAVRPRIANPDRMSPPGDSKK